MTVEIAIMNLEAVALAADSAATTHRGGSRKIFPSQNKLFELSDGVPVGVLIYGNSGFVSIPWETLIKEYRRNRGKVKFDELNGYMDDFCAFLTDDISRFITPGHEANYIENVVGHVYGCVREDINNNVTDYLRETMGSTRPNEDYLKAVVASVIVGTVRAYQERAANAPPVEGIATDLREKVLAKPPGKTKETT